jgi:hypothetical protein
MAYYGDIRLGDTIDMKFTTRSFTTGAPTTLAGTPVISAYPGNSTTQLTAGITLTVDFDTVTGLHNVRVVATSGNGYATATNYELVITTGTVGGVSVVGEVVGSFSIEARSAVMPTTAARTLDVSATGEAGVDWANVGGATTSVSLTNTTVATVTTATTATNLTNLPTIPANWLTAAGTAADFGTEIASAVWQDAVAGDFTVASSIGKSLYTGNVVPGATNGHMISGTNSGTTTLGALTVTGATTLTGNVALADGLTVSAPSTLNRAGVTVTGNGTGAALSLAAGATGNGISVTTTSGNGISILPTAGHGIVATGNGTSKHGALITGGTAGTSDGISAVAGTGGVDIRGNITGNLVGTVSTLTTYTGNTPQTGDSFARIGAAGAGLTNIGTIATCTNLTNAPTNGDLTAVMKASVTTAATAATPTAAAVTGAVGSVTGNVGGNVVGSTGSVTAGVTVATGGISTLSFAAGAIDAASIATDAGAEIADAVLLRKLDRTGTGNDTAQERTVVNALRAIRNKASISGGTLTVTKEDDVTTAWTAAVTTAAGNPLSGVDPT